MDIDGELHSILRELISRQDPAVMKANINRMIDAYIDNAEVDNDKKAEIYHTFRTLVKLIDTAVKLEGENGAESQNTPPVTPPV